MVTPDPTRTGIDTASCTSERNKFEEYHLTFYLIETPFNTFANKADPDQAALVRAA